MNLSEALAKAKRRLDAAMVALRPKHKGGEWEEFHAAHEDLLRIERFSAEANGEPYAIPCDFPVKWDVGAPHPVLLQSERNCLLIFHVARKEPNWDGKHVEIVDPGSVNPASLCLVRFQRCTGAKAGGPNDEVQNGHPLAGRGLRGYTAQIVKNSPWIADAMKMNSVHPQYSPKRWEGLNHYIFWFHDSTVEILARGFEVELSTEPLSTLVGRAGAMLFT